jgi:SOS-response transcriptional repressor LexA
MRDRSTSPHSARHDALGATGGPARGDSAAGRPIERGNDLLAPLLKDLLSEGRPVCLEVNGHSMTPFIRRGDLVTVHPRRGARPSLGEVLVATPDAHRFTVHRCVDRVADGVVLRGDCAPASDPPIALERVLGVVTRVERQGREVRAGLGPERRLIAWLSRTGLLGRIAHLRASLKARSLAGRNATGLD